MRIATPTAIKYGPGRLTLKTTTIPATTSIHTNRPAPRHIRAKNSIGPSSLIGAGKRLRWRPDAHRQSPRLQASKRDHHKANMRKPDTIPIAAATRDLTLGCGRLSSPNVPTLTAAIASRTEIYIAVLPPTDSVRISKPQIAASATPSRRLNEPRRPFACLPSSVEIATSLHPVYRPSEAASIRRSYLGHYSL